MSLDGVSFVVPVHNGERWLDQVLEAIAAQRNGRPFEIIVVDDDSCDRSPAILAEWQRRCGICVVRMKAGSHPAAVNAGIRASRQPVICLVDQDVVLQPGWLPAILEGFRETGVAAVQGTFVTDPASPLVGRVMGFDLEDRYAAMRGEVTGHVCTGNSAYLAEALAVVGLFDESFGYGADNDMSYRLAAAGYGLRYHASAKAVHHWRATLAGYLAQQYGVGYGRLDLVAKHPRRFAGDTVSPALMVAHAPIMLAAIGLALVWLVWSAAEWQSGTWPPASAGRSAAGWAALALVAALAAERLVAGFRAAVRQRDASALLFPLVHLARDVAWAAAMVTWTVRRIARRPRNPADSMPRASHGAAP